MEYYYKKSFLSEQLNVLVIAKSISQLVKYLGCNRKPLNDYMQHIAGAENYILIDATSIVSHSDNLIKVELGQSKNKNYELIFNQLHFYSPQLFTGILQVVQW